MLLYTLILGGSFFLVVLVLNLYRKLKSYEAVYNKLPGPGNVHWFLGNLNEYPGEKEDGLNYNIDQMKKFPFLWRWWAGRFICILIFNHPETVRLILKTSAPKPRALGTIYMYGIHWLGEGLLIANGQRWARNRRLLTPAFHFDILLPYATVHNKCVDILLDKLQKFSEKGKNFEAFEHIGLCSFDIICRCAFAYLTDCQTQGDHHPYVKAVHRLSDLWVKRSLNPFFHADWIYFNFSADGREFARHCDFVHNLADDIIKKRRVTLEKGGLPDQKEKKRYLDFLDILLTAKDEQGIGMSDLDIRSEVDTFMFEGHDTTTSGVANTLLSLAKDEEIQEKVWQEVDDILQGRDSDYITWNDLSRMEYLTMCIKEGLRLYSPVHTIQREILEDLDVKGMTVPKGSNVVVNIYNLHNNPVIWGEDFRTFKPERFSPENIKNMDPFSFVPFSAGPRNCIGQNFAMMELKIMIARIIHKFKLETVPGHIYRKKMGIVMRSENGILLKATPR